jgi:hypothetical protein
MESKSEVADSFIFMMNFKMVILNKQSPTTPSYFCYRIVANRFFLSHSMMLSRFSGRWSGQ